MRCALVIAAVLALPCDAAGAVLVSYQPVSGGGVSRWSQLWQDPGPGGNNLDGDAVSWADFTLSQPATINHLEWWGNGACELGFQIEFRRQDTGTVAYQPLGVFYYGTTGDPTVSPEPPGFITAIPTTSPGPGGLTHYAFDLATPVSLAANDSANPRWFVGIVGLTHQAYVQWNWAQGVTSAHTFQFARGDGFTFRALGDGRALVLSDATIPPPLPGDYKQNGVVDAAEYVAWRDNLNTSNVLPNDPIGGPIGQAQYDQWKSHFGQTAGSGTSAAFSAGVPEPSALSLVVLAAFLLAVSRRRWPQVTGVPMATAAVAIVLAFWAWGAQRASWAAPVVLDHSDLQSYVDQFRGDDRWYFNVATDAQVSQIGDGTFGGQYVKNADAYAYLENNIPLFDAPDAEFERTYYFRWWGYRKHVKNIGTVSNPNLVITEFIEPVWWADDVSNSINDSAGHQIYEGRWLHDQRVLDDFERYWMNNPTAAPRNYTAWMADAMLARQKVSPNPALVSELVASNANILNLETNWRGWTGEDPNPPLQGWGEDQHRRVDSGLFYTGDLIDAREFGYGGNGLRPSFNSYMYGEVKAIAEMFRIAADHEPAQAGVYLGKAQQFDQLAADLRRKVVENLWDPPDEFFKTATIVGAEPTSSADTTIPRHTWWAPNHLGTREWLQYDFDSPVDLTRSEMYWYDDTGFGGTRVPQSWYLAYLNDNQQWVPVSLPPGETYGIQKDVYNSVDFTTVITTGLRLVAQLRSGYSAGTLEWRVFDESGVNVAKQATASASYTDIYGGTLLALNDGGEEGIALQYRREAIGLIPWYFHLPEDGTEVDYDVAWSHLDSFTTPWGLTSGAHDELGFNPGGVGQCCQWAGPIWPFDSTFVLKALANLLQDYDQGYVTAQEYFEQLKIYTESHRFDLSRGGDSRELTWIDENMVSGGAQAGLWSHVGGNGLQPGSSPNGMNYNHSGYVDLIITGLVGLKPRLDDVVELDPLVPLDVDGDPIWEYFALDNVLYHGSVLTIIWDLDGSRYGRGAGFTVLEDGQVIAFRPELGYLTGVLGVVVGLPGDYSGNGTVDAADYTIWRDTLGSTSDLRANGDDTGASAGVIDQADYTVWRAYFGQTAGSGASLAATSASNAIPEPASFLLIVVAAAGAALLLRTARRAARSPISWRALP